MEAGSRVQVGQTLTAAALSLFPPGRAQHMAPLLGDLEARQANLHPSSASKTGTVALPGATLVALAPNALVLSTAWAQSGCSVDELMNVSGCFWL